MTDMRELVATILECSPESIGGDAALGVHPRWDSFAQLSIMLTLEDKFGIPITDETIRRYSHFEALEELGRQSV